MIQGRGLVVVPHIPEEQSTLGRLRLRLESPDGTVRECDGWVGPEFISPPRLPPHGALLLYGIEKADVPIDTRVSVIGRMSPG